MPFNIMRLCIVFVQSCMHLHAVFLYQSDLLTSPSNNFIILKPDSICMLLNGKVTLILKRHLTRGVHVLNSVVET